MMDVTDQQAQKEKAQKQLRGNGHVVCLCGQLFFDLEDYLQHYPVCPIWERAQR